MDLRKNKIFSSKRLASNDGTANVGKINLYKTIADTNSYCSCKRINRTESVEEKISKLKERIRRKVF
jgi:uncharacterized phage infection (PIP) family protein YhgE